MEHARTTSPAKSWLSLSRFFCAVVTTQPKPVAPEASQFKPCLGLALLLACGLTGAAETIPATKTGAQLWRLGGVEQVQLHLPDMPYADLMAAFCPSFVAGKGTPGTYEFSGNTAPEPLGVSVGSSAWTGCEGRRISDGQLSMFWHTDYVVGAVYSCPANQGWVLSGTTCTRAECSPAQVRDPATGTCIFPCPAETSWSSSANSCRCPL